MSGWSHTRRRASGFTLIELALVLALIGIVAAFSLAGLQNVKNRASFSTASAELVMGLKRTRAEAFGRGAPTVFLIDTVGARYWGLQPPPGTDLNVLLDTFNPAVPGPTITAGRLPRGTTFGPTTGYGQALAAPLAGIPLLTGQSPNLVFCSYCRTSGTNSGFGAMLFEPGGPTRFNSGPVAIGQQFTLTGAIGNNSTRTIAVAVVAATGATETFEK